MGISGNERANSAAKAALHITHNNVYQYICQYVRDLWQSEWDTAVNKLYATNP